VGVVGGGVGGVTEPRLAGVECGRRMRLGEDHQSGRVGTDIGVAGTQ
jgi:hypothetical protein